MDFAVMMNALSLSGSSCRFLPGRRGCQRIERELMIPLSEIDLSLTTAAATARPGQPRSIG
jgi:hypothetical protein